MCGRVLCAALNSPMLCCAILLCCMCVCARKGGGGRLKVADCVGAELVRGRAHSINRPPRSAARAPDARPPPLQLPGASSCVSLSPPSLPPSLSLALLCVSRDPCSVLFLNETLCPPLFSHLLLPRFTTVGSPRFNPNGSPRFDPNGSQRITTYYHKRDATFRLVSPHSRFDPGRLRSTHPRSAVCRHQRSILVLRHVRVRGKLQSRRLKI